METKWEPTRRQIIAAATAPILQTAIFSPLARAATTGLGSAAGVDRVTILPGKTYLRGWAGYGDPPPAPGAPRPRSQQPNAPKAPAPTGPPITAVWTKQSGPGDARFADPKALITTATFTRPGNYVLL